MGLVCERLSAVRKRSGLKSAYTSGGDRGRERGEERREIEGEASRFD